MHWELLLFGERNYRNDLTSKNSDQTSRQTFHAAAAVGRNRTVRNQQRAPTDPIRQVSHGMVLCCLCHLGDTDSELTDIAHRHGYLETTKA